MLSFEEQADLFESKRVVIGKRDIAIPHIRDNSKIEIEMEISCQQKNLGIMKFIV